MVYSFSGAIDSSENEVELLDPDGNVLAEITGTKEDVARQLLQRITDQLVSL